MFGVNETDTRYILAGVIGVLWAFIKTAPYLKTAFIKSVNAVAAYWPKVSQKTTILSAWPLVAFLAVLCFPLPGSKCPVPEPVKAPDVVAKCADSNRVLLAESIRKFAGEKYETVLASEDAMNQKILEAYQASFDPLFKQINEARKAETLVEFADKLEKGEIQ